MLVQADARALPLRDGCVQCVVTSPPYWGLRDYGTATWAGGEPGCDHTSQRAQLRGTFDGGQPASARDSLAGATGCRTCGAQRQDRQIGLEATSEAYVATLVQVFREVWRVLKNDGTVWLNLGDSYANTGPGSWGSSNKSTLTTGSRLGAWAPGQTIGRTSARSLGGLKPKDLVGIPWSVAFALRDDGWYLRSDIIWHKPNPMPESVTDRPTKAHEYVFLLTKAARYYYDADAIREAHARLWDESNGGSWSYGKGDSRRVMERGKAGTHSGPYPLPNPAGRNRRSVWTVATQPYPGAHFATMPEALIEPCILAGSKPGDVVLDPFGGTATVVRVARRLNREGIACDLNPQYLALAEDRITEVQPSLLHVGA